MSLEYNNIMNTSFHLNNIYSIDHVLFIFVDRLTIYVREQRSRTHLFLPATWQVFVSFYRRLESMIAPRAMFPLITPFFILLISLLNMPLKQRTKQQP